MINIQWEEWYDEILETVQSIEFKTEPFYHFYCEPFLPTEMYAQLERYWPEDHCFWGQNEISEENCIHELANLRKVVIIDDAPGFAEKPDAVEFWKNFREMLRGPILREAIIGKSVNQIIEVRKDLNVSEAQCWSNALLEYDTNGFHLGPHIDSRDSLLSFLLYLPHAGSPENQGTCVYEPKGEFLEKNPELGRKFSTSYYKDEDFKEIFQAPYRPNGLFGIVNEPRAFHGLRKLDQLKFARRHILWSITNKESNPYPSALARVKKGISPESERIKNRLDKFIAKKI